MFGRFKGGRIKMEYGVVRISTSMQNMERQVRNILAKYPNAKIIKETFTRNKARRQKRI